MVKFRNEPDLEAALKRQDPTRNPELDPRLLEGLSPGEKMTLILWANEGYTGEEIASVLRCSPSTARVNLYKARKKLKAMLEGEDVALQNG
jgi:RNA polymerase sigma-70 factor (ECF subfamily)